MLGEDLGHTFGRTTGIDVESLQMGKDGQEAGMFNSIEAFLRIDHNYIRYVGSISVMTRTKQTNRLRLSLMSPRRTK
jgi:hypothetical protein